MKLNHLAIAVNDLDAALKFYQDALGVHCERIETVDAEGVKVAFLPLENGEIELMQPTRESGITKWLAKHGQGIHHLCVETPDIEAAMQRLAANGAELITPKPVQRENGTRYAFVHPKSAFGVLIELYEVAQRGL
ncbi:MAG TPA: methylmalonyl-CoA epimerase [Thermoflexales bacterium]|nr:methylmalonyl-CoA epimerase [Thermoflexales bacterium]HQW34854.1 methylmalonyl-CoA epimerase [Thermoflexales bacterium]HQX76445.1 methylmalonyl-CoA epimerase [Thermoflexales bacterium]HQZ22327.1 methylmalonyl-CoA epimerase [Thermoflexales bacterium]HRA00596.1 methylmalonyl-CoA epimerase [Thermoflexales bacterium]